MHLWLSISKVSKLHNKQTHKRRIAKCSCCNKRLKKVVTYECRTEDCENVSYNGLMLSDIEGHNATSDLWLEEQENA